MVTNQNSFPNSFIIDAIDSKLPVPNPKRATTNIPKFFPRIQGLAPSELPHRPTSCSTGGKTKAKAVEHNAPINDIKIPRFGTISAIATEKKKYIYIYSKLIFNDFNKYYSKYFKYGTKLHVTKTINNLKTICDQTGCLNGPNLFETPGHII